MSEYSSPVGKMLGKIAGTYDGDVPEPSNELEKGLKDIAENGRESGSGGNVLTLYGRYEEQPSGGEAEPSSKLIVYLDPEHTKKQYDTYEEAYNAVTNVTVIKLVGVDDTEKMPYEFIRYARACNMVSGQIVVVAFGSKNDTDYVGAFLYGSAV